MLKKIVFLFFLLLVIVGCDSASYRRSVVKETFKNSTILYQERQSMDNEFEDYFIVESNNSLYYVLTGYRAGEGTVVSKIVKVVDLVDGQKVDVKYVR